MAAAKKALRERIKAGLADLNAQQIRERSIQATDLLVQQPEYNSAEVILAFLSLPSEINTSPLVLRSWQDRKRVLAPRVSWEQRRMIPVEIRSLSDDELEDTHFNMRQPTQGEPIPIPMIDLVVVPGLGFDPRGSRLGRGRGFYDRFLAKPEFTGVTCGLAFEEQFVEEIPTAPHDIQVDMLVTDQRVIRFRHHDG